MIKFSETITGEILFKRVLKKTFNTPAAGIVSMMYMFSIISVIYDFYLNGSGAWSRDKWVIFVIVFIPIILVSAFKTIRDKIYSQLKKNEKMTVDYEISTWYILIKDWDERTVKWTEIVKFEEMKKTFEIYVNPTQSITIEKKSLTHEDLIDLKELALMKLGKRKVKFLNK